MSKIIKCTMIIVGTLIGAGFASGQEIVSFFNRFSNLGQLGLIISACLFGGIIVGIMLLINKKNVSTYQYLIGENKFLLIVMKTFSFLCFCIMISAIGHYGEQQFNVSFWFGAVLAGIICFILFLFKYTGLERINNVLVPFILIGTLLFVNLTFDSNIIENLEISTIDSNYFMNNWFLATILYTGYNSILLIPILVELKNYSLKLKEIFLLGILIAAVLEVTGLLVYGAVNLYYPYVLAWELPTLVITKNISKIAYGYYSIVILFAIFTTAFSCGYSFLKMNNEKNYLRNSMLISCFGIVLSRIGFSNLINICFPIFGYFGIFQIVFIFLVRGKGSK